MIVRPGDVHEDASKAKLGVMLAAKELGIECNCTLSSQWIVRIDGNEREVFLELAREAAERPNAI
jgi:hypothetical protein